MVTEQGVSDESKVYAQNIQIPPSQDSDIIPVGKSPTTNLEVQKSDSGMEEDSFQEPTGVSEESDEENEIIGHKKPKGKNQMIIDDDDDEVSGKEDPEKEEESHLSETENDEDEIINKQPTSQSEALIEDVEMDDNSQQSSSSHTNKGESFPPEDGRVEDNEKSDDDDDSPLQLNFGDKDVFDAESSDEEKAGSPNDEIGEEGKQENGDDEDEENGQEKSEDDEGFNEDDLDPELLKQLKKFKGASKSAKEREKYARKSKPTADKMLELYSESQRLTRDSRVNLPYYEPEEKSLDDFLARASKKKQEYAALKRANDFQKARIIHEKLSVTPPKVISSRKASKRTTPAVDNCSQDLSASQPAVGPIADTLHDSGLVSQDAPLSQSLHASQSSTVVLQSSLDTDLCAASVKDCDDENDELPDLTEKPFASSNVFKGATDGDVCENGLSNNCIPALNENDNKETNENYNQQMNSRRAEDLTKAQNNESLCTEELITVPTLQKDPSRDLFSSQSAPGQDSELQDGESLELGIRPETAPEPCGSQPLSLDTIVKESPLSTHSTQHSVLSLSSATTTAGHSQRDVPSELLPNSAENVSHKITEVYQAEATEVQPKNNGAQRDSHKSVLDKLQRQGLSLPPLPKLTGTPDDVICLGDEPSKQKTAPKHPGVLKLMDRLTRHSQRRAPKQAYDVDISIVEKENMQGQEELKLKSVRYHVQPEEELQSDGSPGSNLSKLRQKLQVGMKQKRETARQKRIELYNMENEEGYERVEEQEDEEEEAEMTDGEDEDSDEDEELGFGCDADSDDDGKDYNPLLDNEAQDEDEEIASNFNEDSNDFHLNFEVSDEESQNGENSDETQDEDDELEMTSLKKKKRHSKAVLSDDEEDGNERLSDADEKGDKDEASNNATCQSQWSNEMTPFSRHLEDTQPLGQTKYRRQSSCSPDLYATASVAEEEEQSLAPNIFNDSSYSQGYDDLHSQMLDADGYLKVAQTQKPPKSRIAMLAQSPADDIGGFGSSMSIGQIFGGAHSQAIVPAKDEEEENMRELMGLCSGKFKSKDDDEESLPSSQTRLQRTQSFKARDLLNESDDGDVYDPFGILSQDENAQDFQSLQQKPVLSNSDDEEDKENREDSDSDADDNDDITNKNEIEEATKFTGFKDKRKGIRREFLEVEAELSGSEFDSDENLDLAEEDDILEEEEGDRDMAGVSESKLRDQVGKLHMKQLQDDDDREIMRYKEMYLQDGDLYTDGRGRRRNFRWKDIDDNSQQDMFTNESDDEPVEEEPEETSWRKDRFERDKFLEESENAGKNEDSQLVKLGQGFLQKKDSFSFPSQEFIVPTKEKSFSSQKALPLQKKGSFLSRSKDALLKIAKIAKVALGGNVKSGRGFVFQAVEEKESQEGPTAAGPMQPPKRKAHTPSFPQQATKKQKLSADAQTAQEKRAVQRKNSILHVLD